MVFCLSVCVDIMCNGLVERHLFTRNSCQMAFFLVISLLPLAADCRPVNNEKCCKTKKSIKVSNQYPPNFEYELTKINGELYVINKGTNT